MRSHHTTTSLGPLDASQVRDMVAALSTRHALSNQVVNGVAERTGGVPLFVEEVTRLLLERGEEAAASRLSHQRYSNRLWRDLRPARPSARRWANRGSDRTGLLLWASAGRGRYRRCAAASRPGRLADADIVGAGPATGAIIASNTRSSRTRPTRIRLKPAPGFAPPRRRSICATVYRYRGGRARIAGAPLHPSRPNRSCHRMVGQSRRSGFAPLCVPGSDRASGQGDRDGGQDWRGRPAPRPYCQASG